MGQSTAKNSIDVNKAKRGRNIGILLMLVELNRFKSPLRYMIPAASGSAAISRPISSTEVMGILKPKYAVLKGQKTMMYRVLDHLEWKVPDWLVLPGGNLGNTSAFGKAFMELYEAGWIKRKPRIAVVNAEGASTLFDLYNEQNLKWNKGDVDDSIIEEYYLDLDRKGVKAETKASAIAILKPVNLKKALRTLEFTDGVVTRVSDDEIMDSMAMVSQNGFGCEPASAATVAGIKKLVKQGVIESDETVVGILTGHMLKDFKSIVDYHFNPNNRFANTPVSVENDVQAILTMI